VELVPGDLIITTEGNCTLTSLNSRSVSGADAVLVRPAAPGDYSAVTFERLLEAPLGETLRAISLVERDTQVGDVSVEAGSFLLVSDAVTNDIVVFTPDDVGPGTTAGTSSVLITGDDISLGQSGKDPRVSGLELVELRSRLGSYQLEPGSILVTLNKDDDIVGSNALLTEETDIFGLSVTTTTLGSGTTTAEAFLWMKGSMVGLTNSSSDIDGLSLTR
jgi:hypothetical protein